MEFATVEANEVSLAVRIFRPPWDVQSRDVTVVMAHQYSVLGGCQALMKGTATELASRGFTTLTFDMRGAGRSTGRPSLTGYAEVQDVVAVCKWATEHVDARSIILVGNSAGKRARLPYPLAIEAPHITEVYHFSENCFQTHQMSFD